MDLRRLRSWWYWPPAGWPGRTFLTPVLVLASGVLLLGALLTAYDFGNHRRAVIREASDEAARAAFEVDQLIEGRLRILSAIADVPAFGDQDIHAGREYLAGVDSAALGFDGLIFYVDASGMMQASTTSPGLSTRPPVPTDIRARPFWRPPLEGGQPYVGAAFIGALAPRPLVPLVVPVRDRQGVVNGVIAGTLLLEPFSKDISFAPGTHATLVDRAGQVIVRDGVPTSPFDVSHEPLVAQMRAEGNGVLVDITGLDKASGQLVGFATVPRAGWTIVRSQSLRDALAAPRHEAQLESAALLGILAVALGLASWAARTVDRAEAAERAVLTGEQTARETAEATLQERERDMQEREREMEDVCHDLRSPLSAIYGSAVYLRRRVERAQPVATPVLHDMASEIETSANRLDAMIQEMLDAAQLQAGHPLVLNRSSGDLTEILRQAVAEQKRNRAQDVRVNIDGAIHGEWDGPRMRRVFGNLLSNALKFSPDGSEVTVSASIEMDTTGARALVVVRDQGIGIPQRDLPHIFERFSRGANTAGIAGTGVGLAATRHLVELHGGTIDVRSQEGEGSTFLIRLPLWSSDEAGEEAQAPLA